MRPCPGYQVVCPHGIASPVAALCKRCSARKTADARRGLPRRPRRPFQKRWPVDTRPRADLARLHGPAYTLPDGRPLWDPD
jgi:hypothetical protein